MQSLKAYFSPGRPCDDSWLCRSLWTLTLAAAAAAADWYAPTLFVGHTLVLGAVFYWIALHRFGPHSALFVLATSVTVLWLKWHQPFSPLLIGLEDLWVGWHWRKRRNPLIANLAFWLFIGTPASWLLYRHVYVIPHPSFEQALALQVVNGFIGVWLAVVVISILPRSATNLFEAEPDSVRTFLLKRYLRFSTFPMLFAGFIVARQYERSILDQAQENLTHTARELATGVSRQVTKGVQVVSELAARQSDERRFADQAQLTAALKRAGAAHEQFVTMLAADAAGVVVASFAPIRPPVSADPPAFLSVSDREYFQQPMATGTVFVSDVFRGRGFGNDILVAISAPVEPEPGRRLGLVEGSLRVNTLGQLLHINDTSSSQRVFLIDRRQRIIASSGLDLPPLSSIAGTPLGREAQRMVAPPARFTTDVGTERISFLSVSVRVPDLGWTLTVQRPWSEILAPITRTYLTLCMVAIGVAGIALLVVTWSIRDALHAAKAVANFTRDPVTHASALDESARLDLPREGHELILNLTAMADRLAAEQRQRQQLLDELEERVRQRTRELERAVAAARAADRAKSAFLATVSHELRTPLTAIITGTNLLKLGDAAKTDIERRTLLTLEKSSQVLMSVISNVLDYSKLEAGGMPLQRQVFRPATLLADVLAVLTPVAKDANLALRSTSRHSPELEWSGDMPRLRQILLNLAGNALKFTPAGYVRLSTWVAEATPTLPRRLCFSVQDSGPGIPAEQQAAVFEPFVQLESNRIRSQPGTGLGLPISRKLVEMMGGAITLRSVPGEGATFEFWIPKDCGKQPVED